MFPFPTEILQLIGLVGFAICNLTHLVGDDNILGLPRRSKSNHAAAAAAMQNMLILQLRVNKVRLTKVIRSTQQEIFQFSAWSTEK